MYLLSIFQNLKCKGIFCVITQINLHRSTLYVHVHPPVILIPQAVYSPASIKAACMSRLLQSVHRVHYKMLRPTGLIGT